MSCNLSAGIDLTELHRLICLSPVSIATTLRLDLDLTDYSCTRENHQAASHAYAMAVFKQVELQYGIKFGFTVEAVKVADASLETQVTAEKIGNDRLIENK